MLVVVVVAAAAAAVAVAVAVAVVVGVVSRDSSGSGSSRRLLACCRCRVAMVARCHEKYNSRNLGRDADDEDKNHNIDTTPEGTNPSKPKLVGGGDLEAAADRLLL